MSNIVTVNFRNDTLYGVERDDGVYIALRPITESMGLNWSGQLQRVKRDPVLSEAVCMIHTPFQSHGQDEVCLRLELVNGWLFTIDETRIRDDDVREKVLSYKRECYKVLFSHFYEKNRERPIERTGVQVLENDIREAESHALNKVREMRHISGPEAAGQLWLRLGLPTVPAMFQNQQGQLFDYPRIKTTPYVEALA